ncbi:hypothetical protein [Micromonospora sp. URMC 103]|uniref:hypothetical protein n=1 Tax=Micromonospora sp. URMC 103 TaxID=3423406 RepID=UPI003F1D46CC
MAWVVAPNIKALFASVNRLAPNRDKASDGTVGDLAHQQGTSGHNPDDMAGVRAERSDSDKVQEVRAGDVDRDLRLPDVSMEDVVQTVVKTPNLRKRLIYVIYNRRIWAASNGWRQASYTGSNPHDKHAHFSGHPDYDNDSSPWREIEQLGEDDMQADERAALFEVREQLRLYFSGMRKTATGTVLSPTEWRIRDETKFQPTVTAGLARVEASVTELAKASGVDQKTLADIRARVDQAAAEDRQRAEAEAARDAELAELVRQAQNGDLAADEFLRRVSERFAQAADPAASS